MTAFTVWHWILFLLVSLLLIGGRGKLSELAPDIAELVRDPRRDPLLAVAVLLFAILVVAMAVSA